jgi:hypothetical protein
MRSPYPSTKDCCTALVEVQEELISTALLALTFCWAHLLSAQARGVWQTPTMAFFQRLPDGTRLLLFQAAICERMMSLIKSHVESIDFSSIMKRVVVYQLHARWLSRFARAPTALAF